MLDACAAARDRWTIASGARIAGVHYYGPYFAAEKVGCHSPDGRRDPLAEEYERVFAMNLVKVATCAAEVPGAIEFYQAARAAGCLVTCGHSNSTWTEMARAFEAGMRHVDHFWCAMSSVKSVRDRCGTPMQGSMEQFVLAHSDMSTEVIADGCHLAPELLEFAWRMKGASRLCLVTDANRATFVAAAQQDSAAMRGYISASTPAYEQVAMVEGVRDRLVVYQGCTLHSGVIPPGMSFSPDPRVGRLTANFFVRGRAR